MSDALKINVKVSPSLLTVTLERLVEAERVSGSNALNIADNCSSFGSFSRTVAVAHIYGTCHSKLDATILGPIST